VEKIKLDILGLSSSQSQTGSFALVLGEVKGSRRLPIMIGMFEAQAIAIEIEKVKPNRPMTHDLFKSFANAFNFNIEEIIITDFREGVFFSKIMCTDGIKSIEIDARPSDAIAIGIRFEVPIYTYEQIMAEAGIVMNDTMDEEGDEEEDDMDEEDDIFEEDETIIENEIEKVLVGENYTAYSKDQLQQMLDDAIRDEDYEKAAKIRDALNKK
jgi:bifunctional DNase/RNase